MKVPAATVVEAAEVVEEVVVAVLLDVGDEVGEVLGVVRVVGSEGDCAEVDACESYG